MLIILGGLTGFVGVALFLVFLYFDRWKKRKITPARRKEITRLRNEALPGLVELYIADDDESEPDEDDEDEEDTGPRDSDLTGVFQTIFGTARQPNRALGALDRRGAFHITFTSLLLQGESRRIGLLTFLTEGETSGGHVALRLNPETTRGIYDADRRIVALHDSVHPKRWLLIQPQPDASHPTPEEAFTAMAALLIAVLGARLEPGELRGISFVGLTKAAIGILLALGAVAAILLLRGLFRANHNAGQ